MAYSLLPTTFEEALAECKYSRVKQTEQTAEIKFLREKLKASEEKASELGSNAKAWQNECYQLQLQPRESR